MVGFEVIFVAKDGTARGSNIKVNAGRRSKGLAEKIAAGNPGKRKLKIIDIPYTSDTKRLGDKLRTYFNKLTPIVIERDKHTC